MYLVRHYKLQAPYHDYAKLTLQQLDDLATEKISPDIQPLNTPCIIDTFSPLIASIDEVYSSNSNRAQQTARSVIRLCSLQKDLKIDPLIKEIAFSPIEMAGRDHVENPLQIIRNHLYGDIKKRKIGVEDYALLKDRVEKITTQFANKKVLCFSHGFLMRLLIAYQKNHFNFDAALDNINDVPPINYLEIAEVPI